MRIILCMALTCIFNLTAVSAFAAPEMQFSETTFDFGEVFQGERVLHSFEFVNAGQDPLVIDRVRSSCGCTAVLLSEKTLAPGSQGEIKASFDSTRFRGAVKKTIYVYSNDPVQPAMQLDIKGFVLEAIAVEPAKVDFGKVPGQQTLASKVVLRNQSDTPLTLGRPTTTAKELRAEMPETTLAKGETATIELMLTPKPGVDRFSGYVLVPVSGAPKDQLRIPVYASLAK